MAEPTYWQAAWAWIKRIFRWITAPLPAIFLVVGALILVALGFKNIQIGGLLGKLFGKDPKKGERALDIANTVPDDRVDEDGKLISPGKPDLGGQTQAVVVPIKKPGLFDDPSKVKVVPPGKDKAIDIDLPDGVKAKDVDKVVITQPGDFVVTVKDSSGILAKDVDSLLKKYGP